MAPARMSWLDVTKGWAILWVVYFHTFTCWINGKKASEYTDKKFNGAAPLGLQIHGNVVMKCEYRNIRIAEL